VRIEKIRVRWCWSINGLVRFNPSRDFHQFTDELEALCGLPSREELPRILALSATNALPGIWQRARLSPLEEKAINIISVLAFSSGKHWRRLLREFFEHEGWQIDLRGRPRLDPRDEDLRPIMRGLQIEEIISRLTPGFLLKQQAKEKRGYESGEEQIAERLKDRGYGERETKAILEGRFAQDAACRYFCATQTGTNVNCKSIRNDYAKFKLLKKRFPAHFMDSSGTSK
jgi:hypothetical protein